MKKIYLLIWVALLSQAAISQSNYAVQFDGTDDYLSTADDIYTNADLDTGSMAIWFNTSATYTNGPQMISYEGFVNLAIDPDSQIVACSDGICTVAKSGPGYTDGQWHFAVLTWETNIETNLYIDGVLLDQVTPQQAPNPNALNRPLTFGVHPAFGSDYFNGMLDEASIWSKKLTLAEINDLMENCPTGNEPGLLGYWKLEEGTGTTEPDVTANANDLTFTNGPVWVGNAAPACCGVLNDSVTQAANVLTATATGVNYQWIDCSDSSAISGETSQSYTATSNGNYAVIVSSGACADTSNCLTVIGIGIAESSQENKIAVYPNPTTSTFTVRSPQQGMFTITDLRGRQVATGRLNEEFRLQGQPNGIYFVQAGSQTLKLVLAR